MAAGKATLRALLVVTLVSFLLIHGVAGEFECCYCGCYNRCKLSRPKAYCHDYCFRSPTCSFRCKNNGGRCGRLSSNDGDLASSRTDATVAGGGGSLGMVNGTGDQGV